jgi:hypothetical protein
MLLPNSSSRLQASGITLDSAFNYTILAPSDYGFVTRLNASLGIAPMDLLQAENLDTLRAVSWAGRWFLCLACNIHYACDTHNEKVLSRSAGTLRHSTKRATAL